MENLIVVIVTRYIEYKMIMVELEQLAVDCKFCLNFPLIDCLLRAESSYQDKIHVFSTKARNVNERKMNEFRSDPRRCAD